MQPFNLASLSHHNLFFHARLSGLGNNNTIALFDWLKSVDSVRKNSVLVPAFSWRAMRNQSYGSLVRLGSDRHIDTGMLAKLLIRNNLGSRSVHPSHSFIVLGDRSPLHFLNSTLWSPEVTPFDPKIFSYLINDLGFKSALLNLGPEYLSFLHVAEEMVSPEIFLEPAKELTLEHLGKQSTLRIRLHNRIHREFDKYFFTHGCNYATSSQLFGVPLTLVDCQSALSDFSKKLANRVI